MPQAPKRYIDIHVGLPPPPSIHPPQFSMPLQLFCEKSANTCDTSYNVMIILSTKKQLTIS